jgi:hypothetical protein
MSANSVGELSHAQVSVWRFGRCHFMLDVQAARTNTLWVSILVITPILGLFSLCHESRLDVLSPILRQGLQPRISDNLW